MIMGVIGFLMGVISTVFYILYRMMRSDGWDKSNLLNAARLLSHVAIHPEDFGRMFYLTDSQYMAAEERGELKCPFWYIDKDEFAEVVKTRP